MNEKVQTIERFIRDHQPEDATGKFTNLLYDIALAAKLVSNKTIRAGLIDILGSAGRVNVQGEEQKKLDVYADEIIYEVCAPTGRLAVMASEERESIIPVQSAEQGSYVLVYDPLDGSSNIEMNVSTGTIFGIFRCLNSNRMGSEEDVLQSGRELVAAGYVLYGMSTMLVYSTGQGVHGFTLNPDIGEFLLSHKSIELPSEPRYYSANLGNYQSWSPAIQRYVDWLGDREGSDSPGLSLRYVGSLVADFHRNLLRGGVYCYPAEKRQRDGKLRLLYEANPLAFLIEEAGGAASDGSRPILDLKPDGIHQRTPLFIGNRELVKKCEEHVRGG